MDIEALNTALEKIRDGNSTPDLLPEDVEALSAYLNRVSAKGERTEAEIVLANHVRTVLQTHATAVQSESEDKQQTYERTNLALRAAIDLFLQHEFDRASDADLALLQGTAERLGAMAAAETPSPNEVRLANLIAGCLADYDAWRAGEP